MSTTHGFPGVVPSGVELMPTVAHPPPNAVAANARNRSGTAISKRRTAPPFLEHHSYTARDVQVPCNPVH